MMGNGYPKRFSADDAPEAIRELVRRLVPALLDGPHPGLAAVRQQFVRAQIDTVELSGVGFFVEFLIPADVPHATPADFQGGSAEIQVQGVQYGADCILFVRGGKLALFEVYTYGSEPWPDDARILGVENVTPVTPATAG